MTPLAARGVTTRIGKAMMRELSAFTQRGSCSPNTVEQLLTVRELAELLRLHVKTVERMARAGRLPSLRVFGRVRFRSSDIASWLAAREDRACHDS